MNPAALDAIHWTDDGLVPVIAQDDTTNKVLMFAWMNREALAATVATGEMVYWSRSRQRLWHKGEQSGNTQKVRELRLDCDADVLLAIVEQTGGIACHTGREHCFYQRLNSDTSWETTEPVVRTPAELYGNSQ